MGNNIILESQGFQQSVSCFQLVDSQTSHYHEIHNLHTLIQLSWSWLRFSVRATQLLHKERGSNARTQVQKYDLFITTIYIQQSVNKFIPFVSASSPFLLLLSSSLLSAKNIFFASNKSPSISISRLASKKIPRKITLIFNLN